MISQALEGLAYYHTYDRVFLGSSVVFGFVGWTSYVVLVILKTHAALRRPRPLSGPVRETVRWMQCAWCHLLLCSFDGRTSLCNVCSWISLCSCAFDSALFPLKVSCSVVWKTFACLALGITIFLLIQASPWTYYIYCLLPVYIWYSVFKEWVGRNILQLSLLLTPDAPAVAAAVVVIRVSWFVKCQHYFKPF